MKSKNITLPWTLSPCCGSQSRSALIKHNLFRRVSCIILETYAPFCQEVLVLQPPQMDQEGPKLNRWTIHFQNTEGNKSWDWSWLRLIVLYVGIVVFRVSLTGCPASPSSPLSPGKPSIPWKQQQKNKNKCQTSCSMIYAVYFLLIFFFFYTICVKDLSVVNHNQRHSYESLTWTNDQKYIWRTYSSTRLTRWTWVSREADGTLQTERDNKTLSCTVRWRQLEPSARIQWATQTQQWPSSAIQPTYRVTLWTVISRGSSGTGGSSSTRWAAISLLTRLASEALSRNMSRVSSATTELLMQQDETNVLLHCCCRHRLLLLCITE